MRGAIEAFDLYCDRNRRVRNPVIHFSLNPAPEDNLSEKRMIDLARDFMERMGYGQQPYIIFQHDDIQRRHMHIVSVRIDETGKEIDYCFDLKRAMAHCRDMEREYGLRCPQDEGARHTIEGLKKVDYPAGNVKEQIRHTARTLIERYRVHSLTELNTLLELYNIRIDEVKGQERGRSYRGIMYGALDKTGERAGTPIKSSALGSATFG